MVKVITASASCGIATSGNSVRGEHIYNPHAPSRASDVASITVVGPDACRTDVLATAAFAMGKRGASYVETLPGFEAYMIDTEGIATMTSGFEALTHA
jgi:thiamine biosynthesis lipoprotein